MTGAAIEIASLTCRFGRVCALDALTLDVAAGRVTGIVGPNGAGKTTLLDVVSGLVRPTSGSVRVLGSDLGARAADVRARIALVPQETALYDELTPAQNLEFSAALYAVKDPQRRIDELLELVGLSARRRDRVRTLSGGMQRRLAIARALLHDPELLLLDEPTLGVDVEARHQIWDHVRALRDEGRTVLLATNYLDEAEALCDSVAVLRDGQLLVHETPSALVARSGPCLEIECGVAAAEEALSGHPGALRIESAGERVRIYIGGGAEPDELVRRIMAKAKVGGFRVRSPDLMEVLETIRRVAKPS